jgi:hypothetical protein
MRDELETLIAAWHAAWFTKHAPTIAQLMAGDYMGVGPNGAVLDRAAILQIVDAPTYGLRAARTPRPSLSCSAKAPLRWCAIGGRALGHLVARPLSKTIDA